MRRGPAATIAASAIEREGTPHLGDDAPIAGLFLTIRRG
jgi:hypothetical protein